jgi:hypothetical protein
LAVAPVTVEPRCRGAPGGRACARPLPAAALAIAFLAREPGQI